MRPWKFFLLALAVGAVVFALALAFKSDYLFFAGFVVLLSLGLGVFVHPGFFWLTAFVGLNLLQSAFTRWCPMMTVLRRLGVREG